MHDAGATAGLDERHLVIPANFVLDADASIELDQIGTNAKQDVLAIVDYFSGAGMFIGRCAPAEVRTTLEESDTENLNRPKRMRRPVQQGRRRRWLLKVELIPDSFGVQN